MIRINLLRTTGLDMAAIGGVQVVAVDQQKQAILKLVVLLVLPIGIYAYEAMNLSSLRAEQAAVQADVQRVEQEKAAFGDAAPKVEKYTKEKQMIDQHLESIRILARNRLREVKALDALQSPSITPPQVWYDKIKITDNLVNAVGFSSTEEGINQLFSQIDKSAVFSGFEPRSQMDAKLPNGNSVMKFEVEFRIGRQE